MIRGLLFDLNGTLIDIRTDEGDPQTWRTTADFLGYHGVRITPEHLRIRYTELNRKQRRESPEPYPEFDAVKVFRDIIAETGRETGSGRLGRCCAQVFRAASLRQLVPYHGTARILDQLQKKYRLAAVSDAQKLWAIPELRMTGLDAFFETAVISGDLGFRKPDSRLFEIALRRLRLAPDEVIFTGNDMFRDVYGAHRAGLKTVFFKSNQGDHRFHGADPDYIIYQIEELPRAIEFLSGSPPESD